MKRILSLFYTSMTFGGGIPGQFVGPPMARWSKHGTVTQANLRLSAVDGAAHVDIYGSLWDGLKGRWEADNSGADTSGYGNTGTLIGGASWDTTAKFGTHSLLVDGINGRLDVGNAAPLNQFGNGSWWVSFWMKSGATIKNFGNILSKSTFVVRSNGTTNQLNVYIIKGTGEVVNFSVVGPGASNIFDQTWHHIILAIDRSEDLLKLWVDKVQNATKADISTFPVDGSSAFNLFWGSSPAGNYPYDGRLDEMHVYQGIPTQAQIDALYDNFTSQNVLTGNLTKKLELYDSAGKKLAGYIAAAGDGEDTGAALNVSNCINASYDTFDGASTTGFHVISDGIGTARAGTEDEIAVTAKWLMKYTFTVSVTSGEAPNVRLLSTFAGTVLGRGLVSSAAGGNTIYDVITVSATGLLQFQTASGVAAEYTIANLAVKQVTGPSDTGVTIESAPGAGDGIWTSQEAGFNYNATSYRYRITR
jgi:hypothetical protein